MRTRMAKISLGTAVSPFRSIESEGTHYRGSRGMSSTISTSTISLIHPLGLLTYLNLTLFRQLLMTPRNGEKFFHSTISRESKIK